MQTKHNNYSDDKNFCAVTIGQALTTYDYFDTLFEAQQHAHAIKPLLAMVGIEVETKVYTREPKQKEGFHKVEGFDEMGLN